MSNVNATAGGDGAVHFTRKGAIARVVFDRPQAHNAVTWSMYEELGTICDNIRADGGIRAVAFSGAGGKAFIAGTDIAQFTSFAMSEDVVAYEKRLDEFLHAIDTLPLAA